MTAIIASLVFFVSLTMGGVMPKDDSHKSKHDTLDAYESMMEEGGNV